MESSRNTTTCGGSFPGQVEGCVRTVDKGVSGRWIALEALDASMGGSKPAASAPLRSISSMRDVKLILYLNEGFAYIEPNCSCTGK